MRAFKRRARNFIRNAIDRQRNRAASRDADNSELQEQMAAADQEQEQGGLLDSAAAETEGASPFGEITGNPLLRRGSRGSDVELLQDVLNEYGNNLEVDGIFGSLTEAAVRAFQQENGLEVDGVVGPNTAGVLNGTAVDGPAEEGAGEEEQEGPEEAAPVPTPEEGAAALTGSPPLSRGANGPLVEELQRLLNAKGGNLVVDGDFGRRTEAAVRDFQSANGMRPSGQAGVEVVEGLRDSGSHDIGSGQGGDQGSEFGGLDGYENLRDGVIAAAESHLGAPYSWGANGPGMFDCSGFVLYVLRNDTNLVNWGDDTAHGLSQRLPATNDPQKGDLVFYSSGGRVGHVEMHMGEGLLEIGASGGGSNTHGDDPRAKVQYGNQGDDRRSRSYGSIAELLRRSRQANP